jgi:hypothetical protein
MKKTIISSFICLIVGAAIGAGSVFYFQKQNAEKIANDMTVETIEGDQGSIEHEKIKDYKEHITFITKSKRPGTIKTIIKKESFCPKVYKNSLSAIVYAGIDQMQPVISYGLEYRRNVVSRFHVLTGAKVDTGLSTVQGFQVFLGAGVNF